MISKNNEVISVIFEMMDQTDNWICCINANGEIINCNQHWRNNVNTTNSIFDSINEEDIPVLYEAIYSLKKEKNFTCTVTLKNIDQAPMICNCDIYLVDGFYVVYTTMLSLNHHGTIISCTMDDTEATTFKTNNHSISINSSTPFALIDGILIEKDNTIIDVSSSFDEFINTTLPCNDELFLWQKDDKFYIANKIQHVILLKDDTFNVKHRQLFHDLLLHSQENKQTEVFNTLCSFINPISCLLLCDGQIVDSKQLDFFTNDVLLSCIIHQLTTKPIHIALRNSINSHTIHSFCTKYNASSITCIPFNTPHHCYTFICVGQPLAYIDLFTTLSDYNQPLLDNNSLGFALVQPMIKNNEIVDYTLLQANKTFSKLTGNYWKIGKTIRDFCDDNEASNHIETITFAHNSHMDYIYNFDESKKIFRLKISSMKQYVMISMEDVTESEYLQRYQSKPTTNRDSSFNDNHGLDALYGILWGIGAGTWQWNINTGELIINERWAEIIGYTIEELSPISIKTWAPLVHPDDLPFSNQELERTFNHETNEYIVDVRMRHKDGHYVWISDRGKVVSWNDDGTPEWIFGVHIDITERKTNELAIEQSEEKFRIVFDESPICLITIDANDYTILSKNIKANSIFSIDELNIQSFFDCFKQETDDEFTISHLKEHIDNTITHGSQQFRWLSHLNNNDYWHFYLITNVTIEGKQRFLLSISTIEELVEYEQRNQSMRDDIELMVTKQKVLLDISNELINADESNIQSIVVNSLKTLCTMIQCDSASTFSLHYETDIMITRQQYGKIKTHPFHNQPLSNFSCFIDQLKNGYPIIFNDVSQSNNECIRLLSNHNINSFIAFPLISKKTLYGIIVFSSEKLYFSCDENDMLTLNKFSTQLVSTLYRIETQNRLRESEYRFRNIFSKVRSVSVTGYNQNRVLTYCNTASKELYGLSDDDINNFMLDDFFPIEKRSGVKKLFENIINQGDSLKVSEGIHYKKNGELFPVLSSKVILDSGFNGKEMYSVDIDLSEIKNLQHDLDVERELLYKTLVSIGDGVISTDIKGNIQIINTVAEQLTGFKRSEAFGKPLQTIFKLIDDKTRLPIDFQTTLELSPKRNEIFNHTSLRSKQGRKYQVEHTISSIKDKHGMLTGFVVVFRDITEKMVRLKEIEHLSTSDYLTGLYNRRYLEEVLPSMNTSENMPMAFMYVDINGLKLTNDAFGHVMGDKLLKTVADILRPFTPEKGCLSRLGGDEFMIIVPNCSEACAASIKRRILQSCEANKVDILIISLAIGYAIKKNVESSIDVIRILAENHMYKDKIVTGKNMRVQTIETVLRNINLKYDDEQVHSERVSVFSEMIAKGLNLPNEEVVAIKTAALLHDIGKIGVDPELLRKKGALTNLEFDRIKQHAEIGYQILKSVDEYYQYAKIILHHHERWDGKGYPHQLQGEEIPLASRIICVADAFEAMTADRCYQDARSYQKAMDELVRCSNTQFDATIVEVFKKNAL